MLSVDVCERWERLRFMGVLVMNFSTRNCVFVCVHLTWQARQSAKTEGTNFEFALSHTKQDICGCFRSICYCKLFGEWGRPFSIGIGKTLNLQPELISHFTCLEHGRVLSRICGGDGGRKTQTDGIINSLSNTPHNTQTHTHSTNLPWTIQCYSSRKLTWALNNRKNIFKFLQESNY